MRERRNSKAGKRANSGTIVSARKQTVPAIKHFRKVVELEICRTGYCRTWHSRNRVPKPSNREYGLSGLLRRESSICQSEKRIEKKVFTLFHYWATKACEMSCPLKILCVPCCAIERQESVAIACHAMTNSETWTPEEQRNKHQQGEAQEQQNEERQKIPFFSRPYFHIKSDALSAAAR